MKRIVVLGEGHGETKCAVRAVSKVLTDEDRSHVFLDENVIRTGEVGGLLKDDFAQWKKRLLLAHSRGNVGGVVLLLDGDVCRKCHVEIASALAGAAKPIADHTRMSVCTVFAIQEYESWLLAGMISESTLADGRRVQPSDPSAEYETIRNAKKLLKQLVGGSYRPTRDQLLLTDIVDWSVVSQRMRSHRRLTSAVRQIVNAVKADTFVVSPSSG